MNDVSEDIVFGDSSSLSPRTDSEGNEGVGKGLSGKSLSKQDQPFPISNFETIKAIQFMYIQMEFCEKSTLRYKIDLLV